MREMARLKKIMAIPCPFNLDVDDFIAAIYVEDMKAYIGKIVDTDDSDAFVCNIYGAVLSWSSTFKWPKPEDEVWVDKSLILSLLPAAESCGKSGRSFKFNAEALQAVIRKFEAWSLKISCLDWFAELFRVFIVVETTH